MQDGARAGEFLFSPRTVKGLERLYLRSKHLPYQPGATTEGVYEYYPEAEGLSKRTVEELRNRLKPLDTSSPRSTYIGFMESLKRAHRLIKDADAALRSDPPTIGSQEAGAVERDADILVERAVSTLDLSEVPIGIRDDVGIQAALQLKEVLDRVRQPFLDAIPGPAAVRDWKRTNVARMQ